MAAAVAVSAALAAGWAVAKDDARVARKPESLVKQLYDSLNDEQKREICFAWDYTERTKSRGLLRTRVSNNWNITKPTISAAISTPTISRR